MLAIGFLVLVLGPMRFHVHATWTTGKEYSAPIDSTLIPVSRERGASGHEIEINSPENTAFAIAHMHSPLMQQPTSRLSFFRWKFD